LAYRVAMPRQPFEMEHGVLDQMTLFIEVFVIIIALHQSMLSGRDHRTHALPRGLFPDGVSVVAPVGQKMFGGQTLDQVSSLRTIRRGTCCNKDSDRIAMRIHAQMYLGVEPPFVRSMASLPPRAPEAWGWTLMWLASIISHS
jgi:hypothetical protein